MYERFYGLKVSPFRLNPDPSFFFGSKGHNRALAYLRYGVNQKEGFIVITGTPGTGKTTLARALLAEMAKNKTIVSELNTTHLQAEDVLHMVAASYGLKHEGATKSTLLQRMEEFFISRYRAGYHVLLIVDESQNLPKESLEELRMLSNFYMGKDALVQIFLLGQEQFREKLYSQELEQLRQRVVASCHLEPLDREETKKYILHRLAVAGWQGDPQFSERAFARIYAVSQGVPRRINTFCDRLLLYGALEDKHAFKDEEVKSVAKELSLETSPDDHELKDIKPADQKKSDNSDTKASADSEYFIEYSDEVEVVVPPKPEPEPESQQKAEPEVEEETDKFSQVSPATAHAPPDGARRTSNGSLASLSQPLSVQIDGENKPAWWNLVVQAVAFHAEPKSFKGITSSKNPLAEGVTDLFKIAIDKKSIPAHMRMAELESVSDDKIKAAIRFYVKKVLLSSTADYYRRLGVARNAGQELINIHYKLLFRIFQPDKESGQGEWDETYTRRINQAYGALRSEQKRKEYDEFLLSLDAKKGKNSAQVEQPISPRDLDSSNERLDEANKNENRKTGYVAGASIIGVVFLLLFAGGYYFYQNQTVSQQEVIAQSVNGQSDISQDDEGFGVAPFDNIALIDDELPLAILDGESKLPKDSIEPIETSQNNISIETTADKKAPVAEVSRAAEPISPVVEKPAPAPVVTATAENKPAVVKTVAPKPVKPAAKPVTVAPVSKPIVPAKPIKTIAPTKQAAVVATPTIKPTTILAPKTISPPKPTTSTVASDKIKDLELGNFISGFTLSYEEGEIEKFIQLFTIDAATNDAKGREFIEKDYDALFESTEMRVIDLQGLEWDINGSAASGEGAFVVTVLRKGGDTVRKFTGNIKLDVIKQNNALKISGMYHSYGDDN